VQSIARPVKQGVWYDEHLRIWTAIWRDDRGNQIGYAVYAMSKEQALKNLPEKEAVSSYRR
jgi:hypothetical protein